MNKTELKKFAVTLTTQPGVYRMYDTDGKVIYVGKAKNLKNRVSSYFRDTVDSVKTMAMVKHIHSLEVTITETEVDALLLESNLIKEYRPKYNILFRDDKSYPFLSLSRNDFPRLSLFRGKNKADGNYYGPYPNTGVAKRTLNLIQKIFRIRQCNDTFFRNRQRPCLQYQIKRCSAPCVGFINHQDYLKDVDLAVHLLKGNNEQVLHSLGMSMQQAAQHLDFEKAATYRNQISTLRQYHNSQHIVTDAGESDIIACTINADMACLQLFTIRGGRNLGNKSFFPVIKMGESAEDLIGTFITQYYSDSSNVIPSHIYVSHKPDESNLLESLLTKIQGSTIRIQTGNRGEKGKQLRMALHNASMTLTQRLAQGQKYTQRLEKIQQLMATDKPIERIECFDISHISGEQTVASCVVFGKEGAIKSEYRRFNIEGINKADDYAAMNQVILRRYSRRIKDQGLLPDLILIDGGKGQLAMARQAISSVQLDTKILLMGIAKGPARKPGLETLILTDGKRKIQLPPDSPVLHLLQEIRDEAHRFAITGHRQRRKKQQNHSLLDEIEGIGAKRKQQLLLYFGGLQQISGARTEELANVPGINKNLAQKIYDTLHS